jgi:AcrR family transcriptional regulator
MTIAETILPSKRTRLVEAAKLAFYHQGVATTTLADVAALAAVPLGNVYHYFRTKDALLAAVIDAHLRELQARFAQWDLDPDPRQRLWSWLRAEREGQHELARYGCPYGSLGQEIGKTEAPAVALSAQLLQAHIAWAAEQFRLLGKESSEAQHLAVDLVAALQGAFLLSCSLRSPALLDRQLDQLHTWIASLQQSSLKQSSL